MSIFCPGLVQNSEKTHFLIFSRMFAILPNRFCWEQHKDTAVVKSLPAGRLPSCSGASPELSERRPEPAGTFPTQSAPPLEAPEGKDTDTPWPACKALMHDVKKFRREPTLTTGSETSGTMLHWIFQPLGVMYHHFTNLGLLMYHLIESATGWWGELTWRWGNLETGEGGRGTGTLGWPSRAMLRTCKTEMRERP